MPPATSTATLSPSRRVGFRPVNVLAIRSPLGTALSTDATQSARGQISLSQQDLIQPPEGAPARLCTFGTSRKWDAG